MIPLMTNITRFARSPHDPVVEEKGPSSLTSADRMARMLGWLSFGIGLAELIAPYRIANNLGLRGKGGLVRSYGAREIAAGILTLSIDSQAGLISRIVGDGLDMATLVPALNRRNRKRDNATTAFLAVGLITLLDICAATAVMSTHRRSAGDRRDFSDRSGLPKGVNASRGAGRRAVQPPPPPGSRGRTGPGAAEGSNA